MVPKSYNHFSEEDARWVGGGGVGGATGGANTNKWHTFAEVRRGVGNRKPCLPLESSPAFPAPRASGGLNPGVMGMQTPPTLPRLPRPEPSPRVTPGSWSRGTELLPVPGNTRRHQRLPGAQREGGGGGGRGEGRCRVMRSSPRGAGCGGSGAVGSGPVRSGPQPPSGPGPPSGAQQPPPCLGHRGAWRRLWVGVEGGRGRGGPGPHPGPPRPLPPLTGECARLAPRRWSLVSGALVFVNSPPEPGPGVVSESCLRPAWTRGTGAGRPALPAVCGD